MRSAVPFLHFTFMEDELFRLAATHSSPHLSIYGALDALKIFFLSPVEMALLIRDRGEPVFLSVDDPTLQAEFRQLVLRNYATVVSQWDLHPDKPGSAIPLTETLYILLYMPTFSDGPAFTPLGPGSREYGMLRLFVRWLAGQTNRIPQRPTFPLIRQYLDSIQGDEKLKRSRAPDPRPFPLKQHFNQELIDSHLGDIRVILNNVYCFAAGQSPLLKTAPSQRFNFPNIFFLLATPLRPRERRTFAGTDYWYTIRIVFPLQQERDIRDFLTTQSYSAADIDTILRDAQRPLGNERSVSDRAITSGILGFSNPLDDSPEYTEEVGVDPPRESFFAIEPRECFSRPSFM